MAFLEDDTKRFVGVDYKKEISADTLTSKDAGSFYYATDTHINYVWDGELWRIHAPTQNVGLSNSDVINLVESIKNIAFDVATIRKQLTFITNIDIKHEEMKEDRWLR